MQAISAVISPAIAITLAAGTRLSGSAGYQRP
jgi:hypothetical protein